QAVKEQLDTGHEIGPQSPLAAEWARLFSELTGQERVGFCNTGSEAVMGATRIARTVTGRQKIALFTGSYHGIFDEVIVRATKTKAVPAAPGIMPQTAENVLVLDYGTFVRHPLALAAVRSVLLHLKKEGPALQQRVTGMTERMAAELNAFFKEVGAPLEIRGFASLWKTFYTVEQSWGDLLFVMLRDR